MPTWTPSQTERVHPAAIWCAVLFVVGAVVVAGWLAKRNSQITASSNTEAAAEAQLQKETAADSLATRRRAERSQAAVRRGAEVARVSEPRDIASDATPPDLSQVNQPATVIETAAELIAAASDLLTAPSIGAIPEDDNVYSSEGSGVVAPQLTSLGFVRRLVSGLNVRTSTIELVVSKTGTVERAKIFSKPAHWEDALLLSRAKMFQFVPAYRNGFPVRYRFVMDVETSP